MPTAEEIAIRIAENGPLAVQAIKRSVREGMGLSLKEALNKAVRSLEIGQSGLGGMLMKVPPEQKKQLVTGLTYPNSRRLFWIAAAFRSGWTIEDVARLTKIDPWFLYHIKELVDAEAEIISSKYDEKTLYEAKRLGFSDRYLAHLWDTTEKAVRELRYAKGIIPVYKLVDTCAAEFEAYTPYYYSTYEQEDESRASDKKKIMILGGGPNRIGQGIEFDYCCVHAAFALKELGYETIMVNSNPETVSTDYDTSDKLYFEPLTFENVMDIIENEKPDGVIVQFGGQTPLNLAVPLKKAGAKIIGTTPESIDIAEDRDKFKTLLKKLNITQPDNGIATSFEGAREIAGTIGYPVVVRPSYVLGGRAMEIV
jgi:carbamoyl-phosphate synthase large subunit